MTIVTAANSSKAFRYVTSLAVLLLASGPVIALACPVCRDPREDNQAAFLSMTIFMSLLPLGMIGGLVGYLWKSSRDEPVEDTSTTGLVPREGGQS